jgi:hypothetical protein
MTRKPARKKKLSPVTQIRRLKAEVKQLQQDNWRETSRANMAEHKYREASDLALRRYLDQSGLMRHAMDRISDGLARLLGKELQPHAMKLFQQASRDLPAPIDFSTSENFDNSCEVIHAEIPKLRFSIVLGTRR